MVNKDDRCMILFCRSFTFSFVEEYRHLDATKEYKLLLSKEVQKFQPSP
jgi:hypothetical protein